MVVWCLLLPARGGAQNWDIGAQAATEISGATGQKLGLSFEQRGRYEDRTGNTFGKDVDVATGLYRTRLGLTYTPVPWLKFSGMAQDSRAPWYGAGAPNTVRDEADWHEGYIELRPSQKEGFGMTAGRMMLNYGEGRLIGTPQWGNLSRTFDHVRLYWRSARAQLNKVANLLWTADPKHIVYRDAPKRMLDNGYSGKLGYSSATAMADYIVVDMFAEAASGANEIG
jgi:hypothetical protein